MARLLVHVEGQTEETFVNEILRAHLQNQGYQSVSARIIGNARLRRQRGGIRAWRSVRRDIVKHLLEDRHCIATTMVDFYGLPESGARAWPGREEANGLSVGQKATCVEQALLADMAGHMRENFDEARFVPFVVMHEFEGLLFSDCAALCEGIGQPELEPRFQAIRDDFATPEHINDSPDTHPSKRIEEIVTGYEKVFLGTLAALEIGLERIRGECPHFNDWIEQLESRIA